MNKLNGTDDAVRLGAVCFNLKKKWKARPIRIEFILTKIPINDEMNRVNLDETGKARRKLLVKSQRLQRSLRQLSHFLLRLSCDAVSGSWADATGPESCFNEGNLLTVALNVCWLLPAAWLHSVCDWSLSTLSAGLYLHGASTCTFVFF